MVHGSRPDKDYPAVLRLLVPRVDAVIETGIPGLSPPDEVAAQARLAAAGRVPVTIQPDLRAAVAQAMQLAGPSGTVLVTGSLYLVGAALASQPWL